MIENNSSRDINNNIVPIIESQKSSEPNKLEQELNYVIQYHNPTNEEITDYIAEQNKPNKTSMSFNQYLKNECYPDKDVKVIANLSDKCFDANNEITNLSHGDFSHCIMKKIQF